MAIADAFYESFLNVLYIDYTDSNVISAIVTTGSLLAICLLFRIIMCISYFSSLGAFAIFAKKIERKEDIKATPSLLINRCVSDYMACGENGAPLLGIEAIVKKNMLRMSFFGLNLAAMERLCKSMEIVAAILVAPAAIVTGTITFLPLFGAAFVLYRIITMIFDTKVLRERLYYGLVTYINKEIGRFYINDDQAGLRIFKSEIHSSLMEQASILQNSINNLTVSLTDTTKASYETMQTYIGEILKSYDNLGETLKVPVEKFGGVFVDFSNAAEAIRESGEKLYINVGIMDEKLGVITGALEKNTEISAKNIEITSKVFNEISENLKSFNAAYKSLESELEAVKGVQALLDETIKSYEESLQKTVVSFGDAVGSIAEYKGKEAADTLNDTISKHVIQFQTDTAKLLEKMGALFEQAYEQNKSEIQVLYRLEDMMKK